MLVAILLAFLALGATKAQANVDIYRPVGITFGQTARVTSANTGTRAINYRLPRFSMAKALSLRNLPARSSSQGR